MKKCNQNWKGYPGSGSIYNAYATCYITWYDFTKCVPNSINIPRTRSFVDSSIIQIPRAVIKIPMAWSQCIMTMCKIPYQVQEIWKELMNWEMIFMAHTLWQYPDFIQRSMLADGIVLLKYWSAARYADTKRHANIHYRQKMWNIYYFSHFFSILWVVQGVSVLEIHSYEQMLVLGELVST